MPEVIRQSERQQSFTQDVMLGSTRQTQAEVNTAVYYDAGPQKLGSMVSQSVH